MDAVIRATAEPITNANADGDNGGDDVSDYNTSDDEPSYSTAEGGSRRTESQPVRDQSAHMNTRASKGGSKAGKGINSIDGSAIRGVKRGGGGRGGGRVGGDRSGAGTGLGRGVSAGREFIPEGKQRLDTDADSIHTGDGSSAVLSADQITLRAEGGDLESVVSKTGRGIHIEGGGRAGAGRTGGHSGRTRGRRGGSGSAYLNDGASIPMGGQYRTREMK